MTEESGTVVWRRPIDVEAPGRRWRKLLRWYGLPLVVVLAVGFVVGGIGAVFGLAILLGLFGGLLASWVALLNHNERANPEIRLDGDELVVGSKRVRVEGADAWTTVMAETRTSLGTPGRTQRVKLAKLLIRVPVLRDDGQRETRPDGGPAFEVTGFTWAAMDDAGLEGIRAALEPHLSAPYVPADRIRDL